MALWRGCGGKEAARLCVSIHVMKFLPDGSCGNFAMQLRLPAILAPLSKPSISSTGWRTRSMTPAPAAGLAAFLPEQPCRLRFGENTFRKQLKARELWQDSYSRWDKAWLVQLPVTARQKTSIPSPILSTEFILQPSLLV